jgi:hypothetical protein
MKEGLSYGGGLHKVSFQPRAADADNPRKWKQVFRKYFHITERCLRDQTHAPSRAADIDIDKIVPLPLKEHETPDARSESVASALRKVLDTFAALAQT